MTASLPAHDVPREMPRDVRRATRDTRHPIIGGVAAGLARHLAVPVVWVRAAFLVAAVLGGIGILFYAGLWLVLPAEPPFDREAPGLESATRQGRRPGRIRRLADSGPAIALVALGLGLVLTAEAIFGNGVVIWAVVLAVLGFGLLWRQADEAQRARWLDQSERLNPVRAVFGSGGWAAYVRVGAGFVLVIGAMALFAVRHGHIRQVYDVLFAAALGVIGLAIMLGPWVWRLTNDLSAERAERVRTQERADLAAHLHDSVLQTLALIQKNAGDAPTVARLARSQERDLRSWLFDATPVAGGTLAGALREVVREIEDTYGVDVELVTVGEATWGRRWRRSWRRPARPRPTPPSTPAPPSSTSTPRSASTQVEVFVRDRGAGFDPEASRPTGRACATASSTGWRATAAPPRSGPPPGPAPRCGCSCRSRRETP